MRLKDLDRAHIYMGWRIANFAKILSDDGLHAWKASLAISVLGFFLIFSIFLNVVVVFELHIPLEEPLFILIPLAVVDIIFSYFTFIRRWRVYEDEFNTYTRAQHRLYGWIIVGIVLFVLASLIGSFYLLSQSPIAYCNIHPLDEICLSRHSE